MADYYAVLFTVERLEGGARTGAMMLISIAAILGIKFK